VSHPPKHPHHPYYNCCCCGTQPFHDENPSCASYDSFLGPTSARDSLKSTTQHSFIYLKRLGNALPLYTDTCPTRATHSCSLAACSPRQRALRHSVFGIPSRLSVAVCQVPGGRRPSPATAKQDPHDHTTEVPYTSPHSHPDQLPHTAPPLHRTSLATPARVAQRHVRHQSDSNTRLSLTLCVAGSVPSMASASVNLVDSAPVPATFCCPTDRPAQFP
jgi:hypothetical protein